VKGDKMSSNNFKVGDVVQLKSGSMPMTVISAGKNSITCKWFNRVSDFPEGLSLPNASSSNNKYGASFNYKYSDHQIGKEIFPQDALEKIKNKP
jgi:uncharacterized protein YodC (DUF2158 family)